MSPSPVFDTETKAGNALAGKVALITGGDSGIGRAIAVGFAKQGADVAICFLKNERTDAKETKNYISENYGQSQILAMLAAAQFDVLSPHCQGITPVDPPPTLGYYSNTLNLQAEPQIKSHNDTSPIG